MLQNEWNYHKQWTGTSTSFSERPTWTDYGLHGRSSSLASACSRCGFIILVNLDVSISRTGASPETGRHAGVAFVGIQMSNWLCSMQLICEDRWDNTHSERKRFLYLCSVRLDYYINREQRHSHGCSTHIKYSSSWFAFCKNTTNCHSVIGIPG